MFFWHDLWEQSATDRACEGANDTEENENAENVVDGAKAATGGEEQQPAARREAGVAKEDEFAAIVAIGDVAGNEEEQDAGKELGEADEAEVQRSFGDFIDLPAYRDRLHFVG